ncbi:MAG: sulfite exporter TauE/SafE family protein [Rhodocyclaceae bacterium]|nr:sulfite exporter TauE/SafE family protein [Rhodocyclaceae bacterium]
MLAQTLSDPTWWAAAAVIALGCTVQTAMGFGLALVAAPLLVLWEPDWVPAVVTCAALMLSLLNTARLRRSVEWRMMLLPMLTRIPGTVLGAWLLLRLDRAALQLLVAAMVLAGVAVSAIGRAFPATPLRLGLAGLASGFTGTTTSIGGPPMALVLQHGAAETIRANLSFYFVYSCALSLTSYRLIGRFDDALVVAGLLQLPAVAAGFVFGRRIRHWTDGRFRPLLLGLCSASALAAVIGALAGHGAG